MIALKSFGCKCSGTSTENLHTSYLLNYSGTAVWALSPRGSIYRRYGITETNFIGDYWKKIPGSATTLTGNFLLTKSYIAF